MRFNGSIAHQNQNFYIDLIIPFVKLKKGFQAVHEWLIKMIWSELIEGEKIESELVSLVALLIFCLLSLFFYYTQDYTNYMIGASLVIWLLDYHLAKYLYLFNNKYTKTSLDSKSDWLLWQITNPDGETSREKFKRSEISRISIFRYPILGGAFQEVMTTVWRVHVTLCNMSEFLIYEEASTTEAVKKAKELATYFDVPLYFAFSETNGSYADKVLRYSSLNDKRLAPESIKLITTANQWKIYSQWNFIDIKLLLRKIFKQSGFFLFLLIATSVMTHFGELLSFLIEPLLGKQSHTLTLDLSFSGILSFFKPKGGWKNIIQYSVAIGIMIYQGWQLSKNKRIYIDKNNLNVFTGKKKLGQLKMSDLEFVLFIKQPLPAILLIAQNNVVEINNLQTEDEFRSLLLKIESGVKYFQER